MQSKENVLTNTKSFHEIWESLTPDQQDDLTADLFKAKCCKTRQAIWWWHTGKKQPINPLIRETIAKVVSKAIGERVFPHTLFPKK